MLNFIPNVTRSDVERIVTRDFAPAVADRVLSVLETYGVKPWHLEKERTQLACLKLAHGDLRDLERHISVAGSDFRDAVGAAESPNLFRIGFVGMSKLMQSDPGAFEELQREDWQQYQEWLAAGVSQ